MRKLSIKAHLQMISSGNPSLFFYKSSSRPPPLIQSSRLQWPIAVSGPKYLNELKTNVYIVGRDLTV